MVIYMSNLNAFLKQNSIETENVKYVASKRFVSNGQPVQWELKSISNSEDSSIRKSHTKRIPLKNGQHGIETDYEEYICSMATRCVVFPNLNDKDLQDSYGVMGAEKLLKEMLKPGEYQDLIKKIQEVNGFNVSMDELVEEAKN